MHGRICILGFACLIPMLGCSELPAPAAQEQQEPISFARAFDPANTGTIRGRVVWDGEAPVSEETLIRAIAYNPHLHKSPARFSTPHLPAVHPKNRGVANAVVFLRGIDPSRSKAWDHPQARVEFHERQLLVEQGNQRTGVGFVLRDSTLEIVNRDTEYHNLHIRGAAFFALPLLEPNQLHARTLSKTGVVDLTCGAGYYWLHAHLFVVEHPYYTRTDADGRFTLDQAPAGSYEVVCWLPSWRIARKEVDPETGITARLVWAMPKEQVQKADTQAGSIRDISYRWSGTDF